MKSLFGLILLIFCFYPPIDGRPEYEACIGLVFLSFLLSIQLAKKIHWSVGISVAILLASGIYRLYFPGSYPIVVDQYLMAKKDRSEIFFSLFSIVLISSVLLFKSVGFFRTILSLLFFGSIIDACVLIFNHYILGQNIPFAMLNNNTADATFIACMLPIAFNDYKEEGGYWIAVMTFAILFCRSNTAMAALFVGYSSWLLTKIKFKKWVLSMIPITIAILICSHFILGSHFLGNSGRFDVWKLIWDSFIEYSNPLIGFGTGSFTIWGDAFQRLPHLYDSGRYPIWYWLHNEPLEILFENGIIGLMSALIVYWFILKKTFKKSILFPIACVYGLISLTEMPLRMFVTQMLGICMISIAFNDELKTPKAS